MLNGRAYTSRTAAAAPALTCTWRRLRRAGRWPECTIPERRPRTVPLPSVAVHAIRASRRRGEITPLICAALIARRSPLGANRHGCVWPERSSANVPAPDDGSGLNTVVAPVYSAGRGDGRPANARWWSRPRRVRIFFPQDKASPGVADNPLPPARCVRSGKHVFWPVSVTGNDTRNAT